MEYHRRGVTVGMGLDEAGINEDRDMLQEMRMALNVHRTPGMDEKDVPARTQVLRMATEHGGLTTAFGAEIGKLDQGRFFDAVLIDFDKAMHPFQDEDIAPLDAVIQRAKTKHVDSVIVGGDLVYEKGRFANLDRDEILDTIATVLSKPRTQDESHRRWLRDKVFHEVQKFYQNYLDDEPARVPFYGNSSQA